MGRVIAFPLRGRQPLAAVAILSDAPPPRLETPPSGLAAFDDCYPYIGVQDMAIERRAIARLIETKRS